MDYFMVITDAGFTVVRPASHEEVVWFSSLASQLMPYKRNMERFDRVHSNLGKLEQVLADVRIFGQLESAAKDATANFLYSFNECLDHWKTYIDKTYGKESEYYSRYLELTHSAFDSCDEYKITYALRNFQHVADVVDGVSVFYGEPAKLYSFRDRILELGDFKPKFKEPIQKLDSRFELIPIFRVAKLKLEQIQKQLMFYSITQDEERKAIEALSFKENLCGKDGVLLLGKLLRDNGQELEISNQSIASLSQAECKFSLSYQVEFPWGVCNLLRYFKGTNYREL